MSEKSKPLVGKGTVPGSENTVLEWAKTRANTKVLKIIACNGPQKLKEIIDYNKTI